MHQILGVGSDGRAGPQGAGEVAAAAISAFTRAAELGAPDTCRVMYDSCQVQATFGWLLRLPQMTAAWLKPVVTRNLEQGPLGGLCNPPRWPIAPFLQITTGFGRYTSQHYGKADLHPYASSQFNYILLSTLGGLYGGAHKWHAGGMRQANRTGSPDFDVRGDVTKVTLYPGS